MGRPGFSRWAYGLAMAVACQAAPARAEQGSWNEAMARHNQSVAGGRARLKIRPRNQLQAEGRYFQPTLKGLQDLCATLPHLCQCPDVQLTTRQLERQQSLSRALIIGGSGGTLVGAGISIWAFSSAIRAEKGDHGPAPGPVKLLTGPVLALAGLGAVLAGLAKAPVLSDIEQVVNQVNQGKMAPPLQWVMVPSAGPADLLARLTANF